MSLTFRICTIVKNILKRLSIYAGGIDFNFFNAVTPETLHDAYHLMPALEYTQKLSPGEKACLMSHAPLWQKCLNGDMPYMGIFEDDIVLGKNAYLLLKDDNWLKKRFGDDAVIIRLEATLQRANLKKTAAAPVKHLTFLELQNPLHGSGAYIISKAAANLLMADLRYIPVSRADEVKAADWVVFENMLHRNDIKVYQVMPAVCTQGLFLPEYHHLGSELDEDRVRHHRKNPYPKRKKTLSEWVAYILATPKRKYLKYKRTSIPFEK